jgi:hypothetical protein
MNMTKVYYRASEPEPERLTVMAYIGVEDQDGDEIRLIRALGERVVEDGIVFHGEGGERWLQEQHDSWTGAGYELVTEKPGV